MGVASWGNVGEGIVKHNGVVERRISGVALLDAYGAAGPLLPTLFASSVVGVAVLDGRMRFRAINETLAIMNGMPAARHVGRKLRYVLGSAATKVEGATKQVLQTGEPISLELTAELPLRAGVGHWVESYFPMRDVDGRVAHVAAVVLEITEKKNLERSLKHMIGNLLHVEAALKTELLCHGMTGGWSDVQTGLLTRAVELAENCIAEVQNIREVTRRRHSVNAPHMQLPGKGDLAALSGTPRTCVDECGRDDGLARRLSPRERKVLQLLAECKSNKGVAETLGISVRTAETYRARIMMKLELHSLAHLVRFAVRNKIIEA
jgi:PAS domain S-box-containing protein